MSTPESLDAAVELLRLRRRHQDVFRRREQLQERVVHYPNVVTVRRLSDLTAEQAAMELQITELEAL